MLGGESLARPAPVGADVCRAPLPESQDGRARPRDGGISVCPELPAEVRRTHCHQRPLCSGRCKTALHGNAPHPVPRHLPRSRDISIRCQLTINQHTAAQHRQLRAAVSAGSGRDLPSEILSIPSPDLHRSEPARPKSKAAFAFPHGQVPPLAGSRAKS